MTETASNNNGFKQVYVSSPKVPFGIAFVPKDVVVSFPFIEEAPDPKFKSPVYDWDHYRWIESDGKVQGQQLGELKDQVQSLASQVKDGKHSQKEIDAINEQIGSIVGMLSEAAAASTEVPTESTDKDADNKGGDK